MTCKKDLYDDFLLISQMKVSEKLKIKFITELFSETDNPWRVVGITKNALKVFKNHDFNRVSRMGINRSHLNDRKTIYTKMLNSKFENPTEWWDYYYKNDKTIFATSSENMSSILNDVVVFKNSEGLFKSKGYAWTHRKKHEVPYLRKLADENL